MFASRLKDETSSFSRGYDEKSSKRLVYAVKIHREFIGLRNIGGTRSHLWAARRANPPQGGGAKLRAS
jgi:hypothetical protein